MGTRPDSAVDGMTRYTLEVNRAGARFAVQLQARSAWAALLAAMVSYPGADVRVRGKGE